MKNQEKECVKCHKTKPITEFAKRGKYLRRECKECSSKTDKKIKKPTDVIIEDMCQEFRIGDKVIDIIRMQVGEVTEIIPSEGINPTYKLWVAFENWENGYTLDGRFMAIDKRPSLLHYRDGLNYNVIDFDFLPKRNESTRWIAEIGQRYYFIDKYFDVQTYVADESPVDTKLYNVGNYFKDEQEAEEIATKMQEYFEQINKSNMETPVELKVH